MFVRFQDHRHNGLFHVATWTRDSAACGDLRMKRKDVRSLTDLIWWLQNHTPVPPQDVYRDPQTRTPRAWFRLSAEQHVNRAKRLCTLLNSYHVDVRPIYSSRPGRILFEDEVQIVVRPHRASPAPESRRRRRRVRWDGDRATVRRPSEKVRLMLWGPSETAQAPMW